MMPPHADDLPEVELTGGALAAPDAAAEAAL